MITNQAVYNLSRGNIITTFISKLFKSSYLIKRKILIEDIKAISLSTLNAEFVLHVPSEYDYRFSHPALRNAII